MTEVTGVMDRPETMSLLAEMAQEIAASAELLIRLGIIEIKHGADGGA